ncbi:hypothetical protein, partial [Salmonella enterica]
EIRKLNLSTPESIAAAKYVLFEHPSRAGDSAFAEALRALGASVDEKVFEGYEELATNPLFAKTPMAVVAELARWIEANTVPDATAANSVVP